MKPGEFLLDYWVEVLAAALLLIGFLIALVLRSAALHYAVIFVAGLLCGRVVYEKYHHQPILPFILIIIGFLLGFMLGAIIANKKVIFVLFLLGAGISYWAHRKGYIRFFKEEGFIK